MSFSLAPRNALTPTVHPDGLPAPQRGVAVLAIAIGITLAVLDSSVANIALPAITRALRATPAASTWVIGAYQLSIVMCLLPLAALGERVGYRRVYLIGLGVFTAGSLARALAHDLHTLVAARAFQGLGAAGIMSVNGALVRYIYPREAMGRGVGLNALVVSIAAALGPSVASGILAIGSWQWLFSVNVPIGLFNLVLGARALPHSDRSGERFDWSSAALNAAVFGLFFVGIGSLTHGTGSTFAGAAAVAIAIAAGFLLIRHELTSPRPLIPIDLMRIPIFALSVGASICSFSAQMLVFLEFPFFLETTLHRDQVQTGLLMTAWPVALGAMAPISGRLSDRLPAALLGTSGLCLLAIGLLSLAFLPAHTGTIDLVWRIALCGTGFGLFQAPNNRTLLATAPRHRAGAAGGMLATARLTGMTIGSTITAAIFVLAPRADEHVAMLTASGFAIVAATLSLFRRSTGRGEA